VPNGIDLKLQRTQKIGNLLHLAYSFACQSALRIFFLGLRLSMLNQINVHDCRPPFVANAAFLFLLNVRQMQGGLALLGSGKRGDSRKLTGIRTIIF